MFIEEIIIRDSIIHRLDPRVKITAVFFFSVFTAISNQFLVLILSLFFGVSAVLCANAPIKEIIKRLFPVNILIVFLWLFLPFTYVGEPIWKVGPLTVTYEGVLYAALISIKSNAIMLALIALTISTSIFTIGSAVHKMYMPSKLAHLFFFTYRYIYVICNEYNKISNAAKVRGFKPKTNLRTYKVFACMLGMLFVKSFERAQRVNAAMLCRGFSGKFYSLSKFSIKKMDVIFLVSVTIVIIAFGVIEWMEIACLSILKI